MKPAKDQNDNSLYADGMSGLGYSRKDLYCGNQYSGINDGSKTINKGRGPTVGNKSSKKTPGTSAMPGLQTGKEMFTGTQQTRTPGGTRSWDPKREQNYKGNPDSINMGRGPTKGNQL
jgi:hypothetical protein